MHDRTRTVSDSRRKRSHGIVLTSNPTDVKASLDLSQRAQTLHCGKWVITVIGNDS